VPMMHVRVVPVTMDQRHMNVRVRVWRSGCGRRES
jgi:hypothetical protein